MQTLYTLPRKLCIPLLYFVLALDCVSILCIWLFRIARMLSTYIRTPNVDPLHKRVAQCMKLQLIRDPREGSM